MAQQVFTFPADLLKELNRLAKIRGITLDAYVIEKLWAIVQLNNSAGDPAE